MSTSDKSKYAYKSMSLGFRLFRAFWSGSLVSLVFACANRSSYFVLFCDLFPPTIVISQLPVVLMFFDNFELVISQMVLAKSSNVLAGFVCMVFYS